MAKISCIIADDHMIFREGLRAVLEKEPDICVIGEAATGPEAVEKATALKPDIVIMDITMPEFDGLQAARKIIAQAPRVRVVILSMSADKDMVSMALDLGVTGYLLKESAARELVNAIREVKRGNHFFSPSVLKIMVDMHNAKSDNRRRSKRELTPKETEVLRYVADGRSNREIASIMDVSVKTIEKHRQTIMDKLNIHNVIHLTRYAVEKKIVK